MVNQGSYFVIGSGVLFALAVAALVSFLGGFFILFMTFVVVVGMGILVSITRFHNLFPFLLAALPLSVATEVIPGTNMVLPSEILVSMVAVAVFFHWLRQPGLYKSLLVHPVTLLLAGYILFMFLSATSSEMPIVAFKAAFMRSLFVVAFYAGTFAWFVERKPSPDFLNPMLFTLIPVTLFVMISHMKFGFSKDVTSHITKPFYNDHTIFSAVLVFLLPVTLLQYFYFKGTRKWIFIAFAVIMAATVFILSSRAAWISALASLVVFVILLIRVPFRLLIIGGVASLVLIYLNKEQISDKLRQNRSDSNARYAGIDEQTSSVVNITNDQSNAERINRWRCALRMFSVKPVLGFGPGTYQFAYLPFQRDYELTRISVTSPYRIGEGRGGTAHNEFLLVLSESGIFATLCFGLAFLIVFLIAFKVSYRSQTERALRIALLVGLTSITVHSLFNNFMDTDKAAVLVYMAFAYFVYAGMSKVGHTS